MKKKCTDKYHKIANLTRHKDSILRHGLSETSRERERLSRGHRKQWFGRWHFFSFLYISPASDQGSRWNKKKKYNQREGGDEEHKRPTERKIKVVKRKNSNKKLLTASCSRMVATANLSCFSHKHTYLFKSAYYYVYWIFNLLLDWNAWYFFTFMGKHATRWFLNNIGSLFLL